MALVAVNEYGCDILIEDQNSKVLFFLKIIALDASSIIENNKGVLFQFRRDREDQLNQENQDDQENTAKNITTDEKNSSSEDDLVKIPFSLSQENINHISSNNPFSSYHINPSQSGKKIIKFNIQTNTSTVAPSEKNQSNGLANVSTSTHSCPKCNGKFPKFLKICPYCSAEYS